jgi:hypothetical protein
MVMKQTAVDWLVEKLKENGVSFWQEEIEMIEEAKEMEKEQIENAYWDGGQDVPLTEERCKQYYNETFK